uniref:Uncharacterized protein n=1 Tax=Anopheles atroparvus TaxID=41427 RepID=A0A182IVN5_ANOAO
MVLLSCSFWTVSSELLVERKQPTRTEEFLEVAYDALIDCPYRCQFIGLCVLLRGCRIVELYAAAQEVESMQPHRQKNCLHTGTVLRFEQVFNLLSTIPNRPGQVQDAQKGQYFHPIRFIRIPLPGVIVLLYLDPFVGVFGDSGNHIGIEEKR